MRDYTYNFEIEDLIVQFIDAFNDVIIKRYNKDRVAQDHIHANFVYSPKKRMIYDILNKNPNPVNMPTIAVYIKSISRDSSRVENKIDKSFYVNDSGTYKQRRQPVPVNVQMGMSVITKSTQDMLQLMSNWVPYTDPYIYIDVVDPSTKQTLRTKVTWTGEISINQELDVPDNSTFRTGFDTSFTIEGYLFKAPIGDEGHICKVVTNMISVTSMNNCFLDIQSFEKSINATEDNKITFSIKGVPKLRCLSPFAMNLGLTKYNFQITGQNLDFTSNLYISATPGMFPTSAYNYYNLFPDTSATSAINVCSENPSVTTSITSSECPPFYAIPISAYTINSVGNTIDFTLPYTPATEGIFDIIATSKCGCSRLSIDSILETYNPYPSGTNDYENYIPYQPPYAQTEYGGAVIFNVNCDDLAGRVIALEALTAGYTSTQNTVTANSANWNAAYSIISANSASWNNAYALSLANSATLIQISAYTLTSTNTPNAALAQLSADVISLSASLGALEYHHYNSTYSVLGDFITYEYSTANVSRGDTVKLANGRIFLLTTSSGTLSADYLEINPYPIQPIYITNISNYGTVNTFNLSSFNTAKYTMQVDDLALSASQYSELVVIASNTDSSILEYALTYTSGSPLVEYGVYSNGVTVTLSAYSVVGSMTNKTFKGTRTNFFKR